MTEALLLKKNDAGRRDNVAAGPIRQATSPELPRGRWDTPGDWARALLVDDERAERVNGVAILGAN